MEVNLNLFLKACKLSEYFGSSLLHWNDAACKLEISNKSKAVKINMLLYTLFVVSMLIGFIYAVSYNIQQFDAVNLMLFCGNCVCLLGLHFAMVVINRNAHLICSYVNHGVLESSKSDPNNNSPKIAKESIVFRINTFFAHIIFIDSILIPFLVVYALHFVDPCKPSLNGFLLLPCHNYPLSELETYKTSYKLILAEKIALFLINHWFWAFGWSIAGTCNSGIFALGSISLSHLLQRSIQKLNMEATVSLEFINRYRQLQVLAILVNEVQQGFVTMVTSAAILIIPTCTTALLHGSKNNGNLLQGMLLVIMIVACALFLLFVLSGIAKLSLYSIEYLECLRRFSAKQYCSRVEIKLLSRYWNSCSRITAKFGAINFVDILTPLKFIDFAAGLTFQLLLVTK